MAIKMFSGLALMLFACAVSAEMAFTPSKEYVYSYSGRVLSGIPEIAPQYSGLFLKAKLILQVPHHDKIIMQLRDVRVANVNTRIESQEDMKRLEHQEFMPVSEKFPFLSLPVELHLRSGIVESIECSSEEPDWSINIKKGIASIVQINTAKVNELNLRTIGAGPWNLHQGSTSSSVQREMKLENLRRQEHRLREKLLEIENDISGISMKSSEINELKEQIETIEEQKLNILKETRHSDSSMWSSPSSNWIQQSIWSESEMSWSSWKTLEDGIEGICETVYTVSPVSESMLLKEYPKVPIELINDPESLHVITKTRNLQKCLKKASLQYIAPAGLKCDVTVSAGCHFLYSRSSVTFYLVQGRLSNFKVIMSWKDSVLHLNPMGGKTETLIVRSNQTLILKERQSISTPIQGIPSPRRIPTLSYRFTKTANNPKIPADARNILKSAYPSNILSHENFDIEDIENMHQSSHHWMRGVHNWESPRFSSGSVVSQIRELLHSIASDMSTLTDMDLKNTPSKFVSIVSALKVLDFENLKTLAPILENTGMGGETIARDVLIDALTVAATKPCFLLLKEAIQNHIVRGEKATQVLMAWPNHIKTPTVSLLENFWELIQSPAVKAHRQLEVTGILSLSNLIYHACVNRNTTVTMYPVQSKEQGFCSVHSSIIVNKFIPFLEEIVKSERPSTLKAAAIQALGNLGHPSILSVLEPIVYGTAFEDSMLRIKAIYSLGRLAKVKPNRVSHFLKPIYSNLKEKSPVRMAALLVIMASNPEPTFYQLLATSTWFEPSEQVKSLINCMMHHMATIEWPEFRLQKVRAASVLKTLQPMKSGLQYSHNWVSGKFLQERNIGSLVRLVTIGGMSSLVPSNMYLSWITNVGGFKATPIEASVQHSGLQRLLNFAFGPQGLSTSVESLWEILGELKTGRPIMREFSATPLIEQLRSTLNMATKKPDPIKGYVWMRFMGTMERMFSWDESVFTEFLREGVLRMRDPSGDIRAGVEINYNKIMSPIDIQVSIPSPLGFPILYDVKMPIAVSLRGHIQGDINPNLFSPNSGKEIRIQSTIKPMIAVQLLSKTKIVSPLTEEILSAGVDHHLVSTVPVKIGFEYNGNAKTARVVVAPIKELPRVDLLHVHTRPFTTINKINSFRPIVESPEFKIIRKFPVHQTKFTEFGARSTGLQFYLLQKVDHPVTFDMAAVYRFLKGQNIFTLPLTLLAQPSLNMKEFKLLWDVSSSEVDSIGVTLRYKNKPSEMLPSVATREYIERLVSNLPMIGVNTMKLANEILEKEELIQSNMPEYVSSWFKRTVGSQIRSFSSGYSSEFTTERTSSLYSSEAAFSPKIWNVRSSQDRLRSSSYDSLYPTYSLYKKEGSKLWRWESRVELNGRSPRVYEAKLTIGRGPEHLRYIAGLELESNTPTSGQHKVCAHGSVNYPRIPTVERVMSMEELKAFGDLRIAFGPSCENHVEIMGVAERTPRWFDHVKSSHYARKCYQNIQNDEWYSRDCMTLYHKASLLNKVTLSISHTALPQRVSNALRHVQVFLKHILYPHLTLDFSRRTSPSNVIVQAHRLAEAPLWNVKVAKHDGIMHFNAIRQPWALKTVLPLCAKYSIVERTMQKAWRHQWEPTCKVSPHTVQTFDNVTYHLPQLGSCWKVLSTDCSKKTNFAILGKQTPSGKAIKLILRNTVVEIHPEGGMGQWRVLVNGTETPHSTVTEIASWAEHLPLLRFKTVESEFIKVESPLFGLAVKTNGKTIKVMVSNWYRNRVCGVCGDLNGEKIAESKTPSGCVVPFPEFVYSWVVADSGSQCSVNSPHVPHNSCSMIRWIPTGRYWRSGLSFSGEGKEQFNEQVYQQKWRQERWETIIKSFPEQDMEESWGRSSWDELSSLNPIRDQWQTPISSWSEKSAWKQPWEQKVKSWSSSMELGVNQESECTQSYTEVIHHPTSWGKKVCFSTVPVYKCRPGCRPIHSVSDEIPFHCIEESKMAREMALSAPHRVLESMLSKPSDMVRHITMPQSCERVM